MNKGRRNIRPIIKILSITITQKCDWNGMVGSLIQYLAWAWYACISIVYEFVYIQCWYVLRVYYTVCSVRFRPGKPTGRFFISFPQDYNESKCLQNSKNVLCLWSLLLKINFPDFGTVRHYFSHLFKPEQPKAIPKNQHDL